MPAPWQLEIFRQTPSSRLFSKFIYAPAQVASIGWPGLLRVCIALGLFFFYSYGHNDTRKEARDGLSDLLDASYSP